MGGTMSAMYASLFPEHLKNLILMTAPVEFPEGEMGLYSLFTSEKYMNPGLLADAFDNIPGDLIDTGNRMLKPVTNYVGTYVNMWERIFEEKPMETWLAMNKWVNDGPPFPGATFKQWITEFYQQNKLAKGEIVLRGRRVDLSNIKTPLLNIAGKKDHICTLPQAEATMSLIGSEDKEFFVLDAGHVGLMTGRGAKKGLWPKVSDWLEHPLRLVIPNPGGGFATPVGSEWECSPSAARGVGSMEGLFPLLPLRPLFCARMGRFRRIRMAATTKADPSPKALPTRPPGRRAQRRLRPRRRGGPP